MENQNTQLAFKTFDPELYWRLGPYIIKYVKEVYGKHKPKNTAFFTTSPYLIQVDLRQCGFKKSLFSEMYIFSNTELFKLYQAVLHEFVHFFFVMFPHTRLVIFKVANVFYSHMFKIASGYRLNILECKTLASKLSRLAEQVELYQRMRPIIDFYHDCKTINRDLFTEIIVEIRKALDRGYILVDYDSIIFDTLAKTHRQTFRERPILRLGEEIIFPSAILANHSHSKGLVRGIIRKSLSL